MDHHASPSTHPVSLSATQRRLLLAREQCASQSSTENLRSVTAKRRWPSASQR
jgi:hypothetical protein